MTELTITEKWNGAKSVRWTARSDQLVIADVVSPMEMGMVDSDVLRSAIASHYGVTNDAVTFTRRRSDAARVVPYRATVTSVPTLTT
jgi:hypothetical protein